MTIWSKNMDVNARHGPRTWTSTHARSCQNRRNNAWALLSPVSSPIIGTTDSRGICIEHFLALLFLLLLVYDRDNIKFRQKRWAAAALEHVVCQLCEEVIPESCKSLNVGLFGCKDVGHKVLGRFEDCNDTRSQWIDAGPATWTSSSASGSLCGRMTTRGASMCSRRKPSSTSPRWSSSAS